MMHVHSPSRLSLLLITFCCTRMHKAFGLALPALDWTNSVFVPALQAQPQPACPVLALSKALESLPQPPQFNHHGPNPLSCD